jgi:hypothetical protein
VVIEFSRTLDCAPDKNRWVLAVGALRNRVDDALLAQRSIVGSAIRSPFYGSTRRPPHFPTDTVTFGTPPPTSGDTED